MDKLAACLALAKRNAGERPRLVQNPSASVEQALKASCGLED
jgi:hypothetical protein